MPSKNIPVNGWPQIKDLDIAAPILAELDKIETWQKSVKQETKSGAYVEFTNALALDASSVIAEITASQDLHGYDKPWVGGSQKNKLNPAIIENGYTISYNGEVVSDATRCATTIAIDVSAYNNVTVSYNSTVAGTNFIYATFNGSTLVNREAAKASGFTVDTSASDKLYIAWYSSNGSVSTDNLSNIQVESGSAVTSYEPYSNICPITIFDRVIINRIDEQSQTATVTVLLGQSVAGGTLDLTTGALTITHALFTVSNDGNWSAASTNVYQHTRLDGAKTGTTTYTDAISSCFNEQWTGMSSMTNGGFKIQDAYLYVKSTDYDTATAFATAFAGQTVLYELATPTTTTLTAAQLEMVKGYNRISANSGNIEVTAYTGNTWN